MQKCRVLLAMAVILVLAIPAAVQGTSDQTRNTPSGRGEYVQIPASAEVELKRGTGSDTYVNSSFNISIPSNSTISSASVDFEGKPVEMPVETRVCDFSGGGDADYKTYEGTATTSNPGSSKPSSFSGNEFTSYQYAQVAQEDGSYVTTYAYTDYAYHHFAFRLPFDITKNVTVEYTGRGGYPYTSSSGSFSVWLWNNGTHGSSSWEIVGTGSGSTLEKVSKPFKGPGYVDQNRILHVLAICTASTYYSYHYLLSDHIKVTVDGHKLSWASNPSMKLGNLARTTWKLPEPKFNYITPIEIPDLMKDIGDLVKNQSTRYVVINIKLASDTPGIIRITNFKVSYISPPWCLGIPSTYHMNEDEPFKGLLELNQYWTDDVFPLKLTYNISYQQDTRKLIANISSDGTHLDFKFPSMAKNWWGTAGFRVGAIDTDGLYRESKTFLITVDPVNDPPVITPIGRQDAIEGVPFNLTVKFKDVDTDLDPNEEITFGDNSNLFNIDPLSGEILFSPTQEQVGVYDVQITATDATGETDIKNFTLEVKDAEDPPILDPIPEQSGTEDIPFSLTATAFDPDIPYGDELRFSDDMPFLEINSSTGIIDFTPTVKDIGVHTVTITVTDRAGENSSQQFTFTIMNSIGTLDRPPSISPIPNQTAREGEKFELSVNASDPDIELGDALTFGDNCPIFDINGRTGKISFTPGSRDAGTFKVKITVKDRDAITASTEFWLTVTKTNHQPVVGSILPRDGAKVTQDKRFVLSAQASDPDGDTLNYTWKDGDNVLGYGSEVTVIFRDRGTYIITLTVSDGKSQQINETTLEVVSRSDTGGSGLPGFELVIAAAALAAAILALAGKRRR